MKKSQKLNTRDPKGKTDYALCTQKITQIPVTTKLKPYLNLSLGGLPKVDFGDVEIEQCVLSLKALMEELVLGFQWKAQLSEWHSVLKGAATSGNGESSANSASLVVVVTYWWWWGDLGK